MSDSNLKLYAETQQRAFYAFQLSLSHDLSQAQELLQRTRTELRRNSGDLPILFSTLEGDNEVEANSAGIRFATRVFAEGRAWGWLELSSGVLKLMQDLPGTAMMHCTRAWRIWRPWSSSLLQCSEDERAEAYRERIRARLWLGEAWAHFMSGRSEQAAQAILRAALKDIAHYQAHALLQETIQQQRQLPAAPRGTPGHRLDGRQEPYICILMPPS